jgi:uncharacterized membrane protein HdeD (DUF308 family)
MTTSENRSGNERVRGSGFTVNDPGGSFAASPVMSALLAENWWAVALRGVFGIIFGLCALLMTDVTISALVILFAAYMLADGIMAIVAGVRAAKRRERWWPFILEGLVDIAAGAIAFFVPIATILAFVWLNGAWAIITGILMLMAVFRLRQTHGKWLLAHGGIVSVVWGVLLFIAPIAGAVVMTWWLGAYALIFGGALLGACSTTGGAASGRRFRASGPTSPMRGWRCGPSIPHG